MLVFCLNCNNYNNHETKAIYKTAGDEPFGWKKDYEVLACQGCEKVTFAIASSDEETWEEEDGHQVWPYTRTFYPSRIVARKPLYTHFNNPEIPKPVLTVYDEVIFSINSPIPLMTAIGLRALIEAICIDKGSTKGNLVCKIARLVHNKVLTKEQSNVLHSHRFLGNAAAHELVSASGDELYSALDIAETVIKTIYVLPEIHKRIKTGRKAKPKPQP